MLTCWRISVLAWALGTGAGAVCVLTNTSSLLSDDAAHINAHVVANTLAAAGADHDVWFVSLFDSTPQGHFPREPDAIAEALIVAGTPADTTQVIPAFPDAGRITVGGVHYAKIGDDYFVVAATSATRPLATAVPALSTGSSKSQPGPSRRPRFANWL